MGICRPGENMATKPTVNRTILTDHANSRAGRAIDYIVIHFTTSRNINGVIEHFLDGSPRVSAHYIVGQDGELVQMVDDRQAAWHAGNADMNARSIGIEHCAALGDKITPAQEATSAAIIRWLAYTYAIPSINIIPHVAVHETDCPGDLFSAYGGKAGGSIAIQKAALAKWLAARVFPKDSPIWAPATTTKETTMSDEAAATASAPSSPATVPDEGVRAAQSALAALGYAPGPADGIAGPRTTAAIQAYQSANGMHPSGALDGVTAASLSAAASAAATHAASAVSSSLTTVASVVADIVAKLAPQLVKTVSSWGSVLSMIAAAVPMLLPALGLPAAAQSIIVGVINAAMAFIARLNGTQPAALLAA